MQLREVVTAFVYSVMQLPVTVIAAVSESTLETVKNRQLPCAKTVWQLTKVVQVRDAQSDISCASVCDRHMVLYWLGKLGRAPDLCMAVLPSDCPWDLIFHAPQVTTLQNISAWNLGNTFDGNAEAEAHATKAQSKFSPDLNLSCACKFSMTLMRRYSVPELDASLHLHDEKTESNTHNSEATEPHASKYTAASTALQICQLSNVTTRLQMQDWSAVVLTNQHILAKPNTEIFCGVCEDITPPDTIHTVKYPGLPGKQEQGGDIEPYSIYDTLPYVVICALSALFSLAAAELHLGALERHNCLQPQVL